MGQEETAEDSESVKSITLWWLRLTYWRYSFNINRMSYLKKFFHF